MTLSILLAGDYPPDPTLGSSKVFYKLQEEFRALGHHCDVLFGDEIAAPRFRQIGQLVAPWRAADAIVRRMERQPYDVIDVASAEGLWIGVGRKFGAYRTTALISRSNGLEHLNYRRMVDDHHAGLTRKGWTRRIWYPLTRLSQVQAAARLADRLLLLNEVDRQYALDHGWKQDGDIDVVPHGVSARFLAGGPPSPLRGFGEAGWETDRGEGLLFCGTWDHMKGIAYLAAAFAQLHARGRALNLTVLGPGVPEHTVLGGFEPHLRPFVRVVQRLPEEQVIQVYRSHGMLLWTSTYEGFGLALLEAMSQGLPVITTPVGCAPSIARDGENALVVPPRDPGAISRGVERLIDDPALRMRIAREARLTVAPMTWHATAVRTVEVYRRAIEARR